MIGLKIEIMLTLKIFGFKSKIIDNEIYLTITNKFFSRSINRIDYKQQGLEENEIKTEKEMTN